MNTSNAADGAQFFGAMIGILCVTSLWLLIVGRFLRHTAALFVASALSLASASVLGGYGFGSGRLDDVAYAFGLYLIPQLLVSAFLYWRRKSIPLVGSRVPSPASTDVRLEDWPVPPNVATQIDTASALDRSDLSDRPHTAQLRTNFVARYWRGEFSLPASYWGINFMVNLALVAAIGILSALFSPDEGFEPLAIFWFTTSVWLLAAAIVVWQVVGLWRSANRYGEQRRRARRSAFWAGAAQFAAVLGVLRLLATFAGNGAPQIGELYRVAFQGDPDIPVSELTLLAGGTELSVFGGIKYGLTTDVERILNAAPDVSVVHLTSAGGRIAEANKLRHLLRQREIDTYVSNECSSACTLVFAAGQRRSLLDGAKLGYHGLSFPGLSEEDRRLSTQEWAKLYREAGLESSFITRALAVSPDKMWYPKAEELLSANAVTEIVTGETFATSGHEVGPSLRSVEQDMRKASGVIDALHTASPDVAKKIYAATRASLINGSSQASLRDELNALIAQAVVENLPRADDDTLARYADLIIRQYLALRAADPSLCFEYAAVGASSRVVAALPADVLAREQQLNEQVLRTAAARSPVNVDEDEAAWALVFQNMTAEQAALISSTVTDVPPTSHDQYCLASIKMMEGVVSFGTKQTARMMRQVFATK